MRLQIDVASVNETRHASVLMSRSDVPLAQEFGVESRVTQLALHIAGFHRHGVALQAGRQKCSKAMLLQAQDILACRGDLLAPAIGWGTSCVLWGSCPKSATRKSSFEGGCRQHQAPEIMPQRHKLAPGPRTTPNNCAALCLNSASLV